MRYEEPKPARFTIEHDGKDELISIRARKNWFVLLFLAFWLTMWTIGGGAAMVQALTTPDLFLFVWLIFWAFGWVFAGSTVAWQLTGSETLRILGGDLIYSYRLAGFVRERGYRGKLISGLTASSAAPFWMMMRFSYPPFLPQQWGAVRFRYGQRTVQLLHGLDDSEGTAIVEELRKRMPASATAS